VLYAVILLSLLSAGPGPSPRPPLDVLPTADGQQQESLRLVVLSASWCGPCRTVKPILESLARDGHRVEGMDADTASGKSLMKRYGLDGLPSYLMFRGPKALEKWSGVQPKAAFVAWFNRLKNGDDPPPDFAAKGSLEANSCRTCNRRRR